VSLNTEDSVSPVQCNGATKFGARSPFLHPPFRGWTSLGSYFDHDLPDFVQDGEVITATGLEATPDPSHHASDFPAYWNPSIRQYVYYDGHNGYDYNLWYQPVYAAAAGKVIFAAYEYPDAPDHGYGQMVMIQHAGGYVTLYGHFSRILVKAGHKVKRGQQIGVSGNTGHSTGPHLHFTVFHNCTPTDPYGWSGQGPDPLASYQGETASYLWTRPPMILNTAPDWPGVGRLSGTSTERIVLLRLPSTDGGTRAFTSALKREAEAVRWRILKFGGSARVDMLRGALLVRSAIPPAQLYRLSGVVSIATPDTLEGDKADVLAALGRAALVSPHSSVRLGRSRSWSGYLLTWEGRTLLVGRGEKGRSVDLRLSAGKGGSSVKTLSADPTSGAYAIDLGSLSTTQRRQLYQILHAAGHGRTTITAHKGTERRTVVKPPASVDAKPGGRNVPWMAAGVLVIVGVTVALGALSRRRIVEILRR
jgi:murein DD-endopeptidase MepM/ murein hydrolase activator NlpD